MKWVLLAACLFATPAHAAEKPVRELVNYSVVAEKSKLKFVALQNSAPVEGAFKNFSADIVFSPDKVEESSIRVEVDLGSVFTAYPAVAEKLVTAEWFDVGQFPKAVLKTHAIYALPQRDSDDRLYYYADSELTLRGKTVPVVLNFIVEHLDEKGAVASGNASLKRRDFDIGQGEWKATDVVEDTVAVTFRVVAEKK